MEDSEHFPEFASQCLQILTHALRRSVSFAATGHFRRHLHELLAHIQIPELRNHALHSLGCIGILEFQIFQLPRCKIQPRGNPRPVTRDARARLRGAKLPALTTGEGHQAVHQFMQVVSARQNTKCLTQLLKLLFAVLFRGAQSRQSHRRTAQIADKRSVR